MRLTVMLSLLLSITVSVVKLYGKGEVVKGSLEISHGLVTSASVMVSFGQIYRMVKRSI